MGVSSIYQNPLQELGTDILTINQNQAILTHLGDIIENLDEYALNELLGGYEHDVDRLFNSMFEETKTAIFSPKGAIKTNSFDYLDKLTTNFDEQLKIRSFNYFTSVTLPEFEMGVHHIEWGNLVQFYNKLAIVAARDHSKSFTFSFAYPIWKLYRYQRPGLGPVQPGNTLNKKGMIITNEHSLARDFLKSISEEIQNNPILNEKLYNSATFGKESITTKQGAELQVKGAGSALRGRHPGWIVVDDFLDDSALYSEVQREKAINLFHSVIMNMIVPSGQVIVVGTPYFQTDLYGNLRKSPGWRVFDYPALFPDGTLLWQGRYTLEEILAKKKSQGSIIFSREILVSPITDNSSLFPWSILEKSFEGMQDQILVENIYSHPKKFKKVVLGCDFAISSSVGADSSAFVSIGVDELDNYWLLNIWHKAGASYNEQIAKIRELNRNFRYNLIMAEDNAFQKVMIDVAKDSGIKIIPHTTSAANKYDLKVGLPALAALFEMSKIKMPRGNENSRNVSDLICTQANGFGWIENKIASTAKHDDTLMGLWIAIKAANYVSKSFNFSFLD